VGARHIRITIPKKRLESHGAHPDDVRCVPVALVPIRLDRASVDPDDSPLPVAETDLGGHMLIGISLLVSTRLDHGPGAGTKPKETRRGIR
jgi:hypothetical protein